MPKLICEGGAKLSEKRSGSRWLLTLITPGEGSSGSYSEEVLERDASTAWPAGTKLWFKHPEEGRGAGDRDPRDQWGYLAEDAYFDLETSRVVGEAQVLDHWAEVVNSLGEQASLSIYASAEMSESSRAVERILPNVANSVDIVSYPGRPGSGLDRKIEAAREAASDKPAVEASAEEEGSHMDEKILEAITSLTESLKPVIDFAVESKSAQEADAQAKVDAEAVDAAVESALEGYEEKVAAIEAADLLAPQVEDLKARARKGEDIAEAITKASDLATSLKEAAKADFEDDTDEKVVGGVKESGTRSALEFGKVFG